MTSNDRALRPVAWAACATSVLALAAMQSTAEGADADTGSSRATTVATMTTQDFRVAVVARQQDGGSIPTATVRVGLARRVAGSWRELGEKRLRETYFWRTVRASGAVCRLEFNTAGSRPTSRPYVTVQLLLSPSLGCARAYRIPLPRR